jgi:hypothetical protein
MFYVVQPLYVDAERKVFRSATAVNEFVNKGDHGADLCETTIIEAATEKEAVAKVHAGQGERHVMHRRLSKQEIEEHESRDAIAFLRELGL